MWDMPATKTKESLVRRAVSYATGKSFCVPSTQPSQEQAMVRPSATWCFAPVWCAPVTTIHSPLAACVARSDCL